MDNLVILLDQGESLLQTVFLLFFIQLSCVENVGDFRSVVAEKVERFLHGDDEVVTILTPNDMLELSRQIDSSHHSIFFPVIESDEIFASNCQKSSTEESFIRKCSFESLIFSKILIHFHSTIFCAASISMCLLLSLISCPDQVICLTKSSILILWIRIDNEIVFTHDGEVSARGSELDR